MNKTDSISQINSNLFSSRHFLSGISLTILILVCTFLSFKAKVNSYPHIVYPESKSNTHADQKKFKNLVSKDFNQKFILPKNFKILKPSKIFSSDIGTPDAPTIDGGIINLSNEIKNQRTSDHVVETNLLNSRANTKNSSLINKKSTDDRLSNQSVRNFLEHSIKENKLEYILNKTKKMNLPATVSIIPMIESGYSNDAISPKGAVGAWQLMPETAKDYGISTISRYDFKTSTDTALKLLSQLHKHYGSWELAFAAYNAGCGRIDKALKENPNAKSIDELAIPNETKRYVAKIMLLNNQLEISAKNG